MKIDYMGPSQISYFRAQSLGKCTHSYDFVFATREIREEIVITAEQEEDFNEAERAVEVYLKRIRM